MMTSDFILPVSTLNVFAGPPVLRNTVRVWDFKQRKILKTIEAPEAVGTMDVKLIPGDLRGRAYTAGMFNGLIYLVDPIDGSATAAFDTSPQGGMPQILQITRDGSRLLTGLFQSRSDPHARHDQSLQAQAGHRARSGRRGWAPQHHAD